MPDKNNAVCTDIPGKIQVDDRLKHIAFIMDGNRRWAKKKGMVSEMGHKYGAETFRRIVRYCGDVGIKCVTVYAFSTENWKRPQKEVESLMKLLDKYLDECLEDFEKYNIRTKFIGDIAPLSEKLKAKIEKIERLTRNNGLLLNIALNYGSRSEIVNAVKHIIADGIKNVDEDTITSYLYTSDSPEPDLIVRTGGEYRLSNFLLWQAAYSELYFTDCLWPDMCPEEVDRAIIEFYSRRRRFGGS